MRADGRQPRLLHSFLGKIFLCMLLVPMLARGFGIVLEVALSDWRPPGEHTLTMVMPAVAALAGQVLRAEGPAAMQDALGHSEGVLTVLPQGDACSSTDPRRIDVPVPDTLVCLSVLAMPRLRHHGIVPPSWWVLFPALELILAAIVSFFLARYLAGPIRRTRQAASSFAAGDLTARTSLAPGRRRRDEAADLEQEFNRMADRVAAMIAAQQRFIGDVSHEVRSPLGRLALTVGLIRRQADASLLPKLDRMEQELDAVSRLVRELLDLASLQGRTGPAHREPIDLAELVDHVVDDLRFEFPDRTSGIHVAAPHAPVLLLGDAALLRRAVENVLRNALFYTPEDCAIEVLVAADAEWARLAVRDNGPGVPEASLPHLFEPFFRVDQARARHTGGVGLGLAISQRAVALHGGLIQAVNTSPHGLSVRIDIPIAAGRAGSSGAPAPLPQMSPQSSL